MRRLCRKQSGFNPSRALPLVSKWGPSIRNVIRSITSASKEEDEPLESDAPAAAVKAWEYIKKHPQQDLSAPGIQSEGSNIVFLRRKPGSKSIGKQSQHYYIPTPHLRAIFEEHHRRLGNQDFLRLYFLLSSHSLTRTSAGWVHERLMHQLLATSGETFSIFRGPTKHNMQASLKILSGTAASLKKAGANDSFYWIPAIVNFPGIDSVLGDSSGNVYTFQATIAEKHSDPRAGIQKVWDNFKREVRDKRSWHCVIFAEDKQAADRHVDVFSDYLNGLTLGGAPVQVWGWFPSR